MPFVMLDSTAAIEERDVAYDETLTNRADILVFEEGHRLMDYFIRGE